MPFGNNPTQMDVLSTPYGLSGQLSPEIALEQQALNRKQMIANALLQQGMNPAQGQMVGRFYVPASPLQHVGSLAQTAVGAFGTGHLDDQRKGLIQQQQQIKADAIRKFMEQTQGRDIPERTLPQGSPEQVIPNGPPVQDDSKNYGMAPAPMQQPTTTIPAVPPTQGPVNPAMHEPAPEHQRRQAIIEAMTSQVPGMREAAQFLQQQEALQAQREAQKAYQQESLDVRREGIQSNAQTRAEMIRGNMLNTQAQIEARMQSGRDANDLKAELERQKADLQKTLHGMDNKRAIDVATIMADSRKDVAGMKAGKPAELKEEGQRQVQELVATLRDQFGQLRELGGVADTDKSAMSNIGPGLATTTPGRAMGKLFGTKEQSLRNTIEQTRPLLVSSIMRAMGITAKQLDSNAELRLWLSTATDPTLDYQTNMKALDNVEKLLSGGAAQAPAQPAGQAPASSGGWSIRPVP